MLPALTTLGAGLPRPTAEVRDVLAKQFGLSEAELAQMLPSGKQTTFTNRVAWAYSYLKQAGLISSPKRGVYEITERGRNALAPVPMRIDIAFLTQYPEFQAFRKPAASDADTPDIPTASSAVALTPD